MKIKNWWSLSTAALSGFLLFVAFCCKEDAKQNKITKSDSNELQEMNFTWASQQDQKQEVRLQIPNYPLVNERDLDVLMKAIGDARVVLLGEATHGTSEFYTWRAAITKRLIQEKGFDFIATESEWADSYRVNNFIKSEKKDSAAVIKLLQNYNRWPTWMWGNHEVAELVQWLNNYNQNRTGNNKVGFYGLDVYCLWEAISEVMPYLHGTEPSMVKAAEKIYKCFQPFNSNTEQYAIAVANASANCKRETNQFWKSIQKITAASANKTEAHFVMEQNALVALNGERYYTSMTNSNAESWNIRDGHMANTLKRLINFHGANSKAVIWEHNTHVGDARYTDMAQEGMVNVGQLVRKEFGEENVFIVGFGTNSGTVIASKEWGSPFEKMQVPEASPGSWEQILHQLSPANKIILSKDIEANKFFKRPVGHRAIGVVYRSDQVQFGYYVPTIMPRRYDAFLFIDKTTALHPISIPVKTNEPPDLYPWGK